MEESHEYSERVRKSDRHMGIGPLGRGAPERATSAVP